MPALKPALKTLALAVQIIAFFALTAFVALWVYSITRFHDAIGPLGWGVTATLIVSYVIIVIGAVVYVRRQHPSRFLVVAMWATTVLSWLIFIVPYLVGGALDELGIHCQELYGFPVSCVYSWQSTVFALLSAAPYYYFTLPILLAVPVLAVIGIWKTLRQSQS